MQADGPDQIADPLDPALLPLIDSVLLRDSWMPRLPDGLRANYQATDDRSRRAANRRVIALLTVLFDLFWFLQWQPAPDIVLRSGVARLAIYTPAVIIFIILDRRGRLGRLYGPVLLAVALAPCVITAWLCLATAEMLPQPELYGTPLILLYTGILLRMPLRLTMVNVTISTIVYVTGLLVCPMLPRDQIGTMIFIQLIISVAAVTFNIQLETRDRRVFLLTQNERIRRALVVEQNSGLLRQTQTDALTSLANRRCFDETLSFRWLEALGAKTPISLIMIDVDHFKMFNDHYGHIMGDDCLRRVAGQLSAHTRRAQMIARYGGEEFAVILPGEGLQAARQVAERLRMAVEDMALPHEGAGKTVTISLGVASTVPAVAHGARQLIEAADRNLYEAKRAGRNRVCTGLAADAPIHASPEPPLII